jgi:hypothetical protein
LLFWLNNYKYKNRFYSSLKEDMTFLHIYHCDSHLTEVLIYKYDRYVGEKRVRRSNCHSLALLSIHHEKQSNAFFIFQ